MFECESCILNYKQKRFENNAGHAEPDYMHYIFLLNNVQI